MRAGGPPKDNKTGKPGRRAYCRQPENCVAGRSGCCRICHEDKLAALAERMRKLNADPEFAAANADRMRKRQADPAFKAANAERIRQRNADPEFRERLRHGIRQSAARRREYFRLRREGLSREAALAAAEL